MNSQQKYTRTHTEQHVIDNNCKAMRGKILIRYNHNTIITDGQY